MFSPLCFAFCLGLYVCYRYCPLCLLCLYWFFFLLMFVFLSLLSMFLSFVFYNTNPFCVKSTPYVVFVWFHCIEIEILIWSQKKKSKKTHLYQLIPSKNSCRCQDFAVVFPGEDTLHHVPLHGPRSLPHTSLSSVLYYSLWSAVLRSVNEANSR